MKLETKIQKKLEPYQFDFEKNESYHIEDIVIGNNKYIINLRRCELGKSEYLVRGMVSLADIDGFILQLSGTQRKEVEERLNKKGKLLKKHDSRSSVKKAVYCRTTDSDEVKEKIRKAIMCLESEYSSQIRENISRERDVASMSLSELLDVHLEKYLISKGNKKSQTELRRKLQKVAILIENPLNTITVGRIKKIASEKALSREYFLATAGFIDYLLKESYTDDKNVFREYLGKSKGKKNIKKLQSDAVSSDVLTFAEELSLNRQIEENITKDPIWAALVLIKDAGFQAQDAASIKYKDISYDADNECMFIRWKNKNTTSPIQDYTFPVSPFASKMLKLRMDAIKETNSNELNDQYIVAKESGEPVTDKEVRDFCRRILTYIGNEYAQKAGLPYLARESGVTILRDTYKYRLREYCKITDENVIRFLSHESVGTSVLSRNYRSFTQRTGRRYLAMMLKIDRRFLDHIKNTSVKTRKENGKQINIFHAISNTDQTVITFEYTPKCEETIELYSKYGLTFTTSVDAEHHEAPTSHDAPECTSEEVTHNDSCSLSSN